MGQATHHRAARPAEVASGRSAHPGALSFEPYLNLNIQASRSLSPRPSVNLLPVVAARLSAAQLEECHFLFFRDVEPVGHQWFAGEHDRVEIDTRAMFHHALNQGATHLIIAHNHPSGNPSPSRVDVQFTRHISSIGKALSILAVDHVIFAQDRHFSFRVEGLM